MEVKGEYSYYGSYSSIDSDSTISYSSGYDYSDYYANNTGETCNKTEVMLFGAMVTPIFFALVIMFSCVGNVLVLGVLLKYENLKSLTNTFLLNLAISDLIFTFGLPFWAMDLILGWIFGNLVCKSVSFIFYIGYYSSLLFLMVMTVHRYMAIVHPLSMFWNGTQYHSIGISVFIWLLSFCAAIPHLVFNSTVTVDGRGYCDLSAPSYGNVSAFISKTSSSSPPSLLSLFATFGFLAACLDLRHTLAPRPSG
ncbi:C-C chemokine receptor type 2 [Bagarius yarrelli]|uniref:C-C chemokine receptor type 2 n=1 Tax=Bagarius yarrelli TaxID=175774 RepID=A0A556V9R5_BAGYA|nr:C-C chemokine receptor type 2 [Bagarius yarrelli]